MDEQSKKRLDEVMDAVNEAVAGVYDSAAHAAYKRQHPMYYYPDGKPIVSDDLMDDTIKWALLFEESEERIVGRTKTLYGENLSTVWLGMDHGFRCGQPLIFETMLFAPELGQQAKWGTIETDCEREARELREKYIKKHFPPRPTATVLRDPTRSP